LPDRRLDTLAAEGLSSEPGKRLEQTAFIMSVLTEAFAARELGVVLVGGSAIEIWAPGAHLSDDTDVVVTSRNPRAGQAEDVAAVMHTLGFQRSGLGWTRGGIYVHVVGYRMEEPTAMVAIGPVRFEVVRPEVPLADRIVGFKHWPNTTSYGTQALQMLASLGGSLDESWLRARLARENAVDALDALRAILSSTDPVTDAMLATAQQRLRTGLSGGESGDDGQERPDGAARNDVDKERGT